MLFITVLKHANFGENELFVILNSNLGFFFPFRTAKKPPQAHMLTSMVE